MRVWPKCAIRRVVATYARAIETKDVALFRTVKPNLSLTANVIGGLKAAVYIDQDIEC